MTPDDPIKLVSQLLDLPLVDKDDCWCGIVDDIEFTGGAGREARIKALLVGPGAYQARLPRWAFWLVRKIAGDRITRVPIEAVDSIRGFIQLNRTAEQLKLYGAENGARRWIPRHGAM
jgi:hypothetical protein